MTNKEAVERFKVIKSLGKDDKYITDLADVAINALEKQIPKKPIYKTFATGDTVAFECPTCHKHNFDDGKLFGDYCPYCGQAIDWRIKMTNEEALRLLEIHYEYQEDFDCNDELVTALAHGIHALKKQIPVKPIPVWSAEDVTKISGYMCPKCGSAMVTVGRTKLKVCNECFQALDWSDEL